MIIVLAIISVLAGTTISVYITMKPVLRLSGATRQIMGDLMWARMQAISQNNEFKIIYNNNHQYSILDDDNNNGIRDNDESLIKKNLHDKYDDVTYSSSNINNLIFFPRGNATNLTTITLTNISGIRTVSVAITGRVKR
jgi:Type II transport protein GspH.